jgi:hypothetical protein
MIASEPVKQREKQCYNFGLASTWCEPDGPVAQLVEQRIENPRVGGSIPPQATTPNPGYTLQAVPARIASESIKEVPC